MESAPAVRHPRGRVNGAPDPGRPPRQQLHSRNKQWVAGENLNGQRSGAGTPSHGDRERWERRGHRGGRGTRGVRGGQGAKFQNVSLRAPRNGHESSGAVADAHMDDDDDDADEAVVVEEVKDPEEPVFETAEEREKFWQEV